MTDENNALKEINGANEEKKVSTEKRRRTKTDTSKSKTTRSRKNNKYTEL